MQISVGQLPWWGQVVAVALLAAGGVYAVETYVISDMTAEVRTREATLGQLRQEIQRGMAIARRLPQFRAEVVDLEHRLDALRAVLPEQKDVGDLLRRIQTLAMQSSLTIRGFTPQPIQQKDMHVAWPIGLKIEGTYHNLGLFFDRVRKFPRIINVSDLTIKGVDKPTPTVSIEVDCVATTFVLSEKPAAPSAGAVRPTPPPPTKTGP